MILTSGPPNNSKGKPWDTYPHKGKLSGNVLTFISHSKSLNLRTFPPQTYNRTLTLHKKRTAYLALRSLVHSSGFGFFFGYSDFGKHFSSNVMRRKPRKGVRRRQYPDSFLSLLIKNLTRGRGSLHIAICLPEHCELLLLFL